MKRALVNLICGATLLLGNVALAGEAFHIGWFCENDVVVYGNRPASKEFFMGFQDGSPSLVGAFSRGKALLVDLKTEERHVLTRTVNADTILTFDRGQGRYRDVDSGSSVKFDFHYAPFVGIEARVLRNSQVLKCTGVTGTYLDGMPNGIPKSITQP